MVKHVGLVVFIFLCSWSVLIGQVLRHLGDNHSNDPLVVTMVIPHLDAVPPYLTLEGRNFGPSQEVFLGSVAGSMESLAITTSSDKYLESEPDFQYYRCGQGTRNPCAPGLG